jgi:hypothetical protein
MTVLLEEQEIVDTIRSMDHDDLGIPVGLAAVGNGPVDQVGILRLHILIHRNDDFAKGRVKGVGRMKRLPGFWR